MEPRFPRHPASAPGDFYVVNGECVACGVPHATAPELFDWVENGYPHCYWKRQPETAEELKKAIKVLQTQEVGCHRYAGSDPEVLAAVPECCDNVPAMTGGETREHVEPQFLIKKDGDGLLRRLWKKLGRR